MAQPFTRLVHPDPLINKITQDLYDKLAAVLHIKQTTAKPTQVTATTLVQLAQQVVSIDGAIGQAVQPQFPLVVGLPVLPSNNPTQGAPYAQDGVLVEFSPSSSDHGVLFRYSSTDFSWHYEIGKLSRTQSNLAALASLLTTVHTGLIVDVTDYAHDLRWNGAAYVYADPSDPAGRVEGFLVDPATGWHLLDGTTVTYLKPDGTTGSVALPDLTSAGANAAYLKMGSPASATPNAAVAPTVTNPANTGSATAAIQSNTTGASVPTPTGSGTAVISNDTDAGTTVLTAGAVTVALRPHTHTDSGHTHSVGTMVDPGHAHTDAGHTHTIAAPTVGTNGEPRNLLLRPFMRL